MCLTLKKEPSSTNNGQLLILVPSQVIHTPLKHRQEERRVEGYREERGQRKGRERGGRGREWMGKGRGGE